MQNSILSVVALAALAPLGWSQSLAGSNPELDSALGAWRTAHGSSWNFTLDRQTGWAQFVYGGHTSAPVIAPVSDADFAALALEAAPAAAGFHGLELATLGFEETAFLPLGQIGSTDKQSVRLRQSVGGVRVEGAWLNLLFSMRGELLSVQSTGLPNASAIGTQPAFNAREAAQLARTYFLSATHLDALSSGKPELLIAQIVADGQRSGRLAWKIECNWSAPDTEPLRKLVYVDAQSGALLRMDEGIHHFDLHGTVSANATPGTLPDQSGNPETSQIIKYGRVQTSSGTVFTDANGFYIFPSINVSTSVTFKFTGTYAAVNYSPGADYQLVQTLPPNTDNITLMNPTSSSTVTPQANAYIVSTMMRDWIRGINPTDAHGDFVTDANVNVSGTCNAFYNGSSINFFPSGGGCVNTAYSTIITHEQGHWMNDRYNTDNGGDGMGEGNADVWAMYLWDTAIIGQNFSGGGFLRTGANLRQYCGDGNGGCYGEVHNDGEVWMGAAWKVRNNLNATLGNSAGDLAANTLFLAWMNGYNQQQIHSVIETQWVTLDDDDGNISNGSPNFDDIDDAFRDQGFPGLVVVCPPPTNVCVTTLNSTGGPAVMTWTGTNEISNNDLMLWATGLPANKAGLFFYSQTQAQVVFGNGWRCVGAPIKRGPVVFSNVFGDMVWQLNLNALPGGLQMHSGETWYFQAGFRAPAAGGAGYDTSDALRVPWCP